MPRQKHSMGTYHVWFTDVQRMCVIACKLFQINDKYFKFQFRFQTRDDGDFMIVIQVSR